MVLFTLFCQAHPQQCLPTETSAGRTQRTKQWHLPRSFKNTAPLIREGPLPQSFSCMRAPFLSLPGDLFIAPGARTVGFLLELSVCTEACFCLLLPTGPQHAESRPGYTGVKNRVSSPIVQVTSNADLYPCPPAAVYFAEPLHCCSLHSVQVL